MHIESLSWDSNFFGYRVGHLQIIHSKDESEIENVLNDEGKDYHLVYISVPDNQSLSQNFCNKIAIRLIDEKVVFGKNLDSSLYPLEINLSVSSVKQNYYPELKSLAIQSGHQSRFKIDPNISDSQFERMYEIWIQRSIDGTLADECFAFFVAQSPVGIVTLKFYESFSNIGLIAVDQLYRGKNIGYHLLFAAEQYTIQHGLMEIKVATQKRNEAACNFYYKNGYQLLSTTNIYHFWNDDCDSIQ